MGLKEFRWTKVIQFVNHMIPLLMGNNWHWFLWTYIIKDGRFLFKNDFHCNWTSFINASNSSVYWSALYWKMTNPGIFVLCGAETSPKKFWVKWRVSLQGEQHSAKVRLSESKTQWEQDSVREKNQREQDSVKARLIERETHCEQDSLRAIHNVKKAQWEKDSAWTILSETKTQWKKGSVRAKLNDSKTQCEQD